MATLLLCDPFLKKYGSVLREAVSVLPSDAIVTDLIVTGVLPDVLVRGAYVVHETPLLNRQITGLTEMGVRIVPLKSEYVELEEQIIEMKARFQMAST